MKCCTFYHFCLFLGHTGQCKGVIPDSLLKSIPGDVEIEPRSASSKACCTIGPAPTLYKTLYLHFILTV